MVFNEINIIKWYFLCVKQIELGKVIKYCLEADWSSNLDNFPLKHYKFWRHGMILTDNSFKKFHLVF